MSWFWSCFLPYPVGANHKKIRQVYTRLFQTSEESLSITKVWSVSQEEGLIWDFSIRMQLNESNASMEEEEMRMHRLQRKQEVIHKSWKVYFARSERWQLGPLNQNDLSRLQSSSGWGMLSLKEKNVTTITCYSWYSSVTANENRSSPLLEPAFPYNIRNPREYLGFGN